MCKSEFKFCICKISVSKNVLNFFLSKSSVYNNVLIFCLSKNSRIYVLYKIEGILYNMIHESIYDVSIDENSNLKKISKVFNYQLNWTWSYAVIKTFLVFFFLIFLNALNNFDDSLRMYLNYITCYTTYIYSCMRVIFSRNWYWNVFSIQLNAYKIIPSYWFN